MFICLVVSVICVRYLTYLNAVLFQPVKVQQPLPVVAGRTLPEGPRGRQRGHGDLGRGAAITGRTATEEVSRKFMRYINCIKVKVVFI